LLNPVDPLGTKDKFKFTGEALDPQTGLYYLRARYYDPSVGRFISKDPLLGVASAPATTNRYVYALNNPMQYTDRSGMSAEPAGSDTFVWRPATLAPSLMQSTYSVQVSGQTYAGGPASIEPGTADIGGFLGYAALVGLAAINPEIADVAQPFIEDALNVASPPSVPSAIGGAVANIVTGFKDLIWDTLISPIVTPIQSGISDLYTNLVTHSPPSQNSVYLQAPPQQNSDFDVLDLSNYQ
jgi:RHS repeat-associated protein